ncbi:hypothetical protein ADICYQ_0589 [Cyclobacterium qasimii M12-11B]|uniref:Uncharacterized protein n=1 Tax=Cyclobacterium qasimii M12-11B TaxID=641524 RepID=S7VP31_9BACT|nr:hypothetical protein ADICYQ_0589 [Cyclobacterium qasimii M12-11B]
MREWLTFYLMNIPKLIDVLTKLLNPFFLQSHTQLNWL